MDSDQGRYGEVGLLPHRKALVYTDGMNSCRFQNVHYSLLGSSLESQATSIGAMWRGQGCVGQYTNALSAAREQSGQCLLVYLSLHSGFRLNLSDIQNLPLHALDGRQPGLGALQGQVKHAGRQAVGLGALGVEFGLDVVIPSLFGQFGPVGVDQERLAQGNEFCPAGGQCFGSLGCGVEVAHADEGKLAADVLMQLFDTGAVRICAATGFLVEVPQGDVQVLQRFLHQGVDEGEGVGHGDAVLAGFFG